MSADGFVSHVVGARPNFMKAAPVIAGLEELGIPQRIIHTGQHYDDALSEVFFRELGVRAPDVNMGVRSGSHAEQTAAVMVALEQELANDRPALVLVYGDINSTVAAALVCAKAMIPFGHVEAGLRSFDPTMPEEVNRKVTDALADLHFATSPEALVHLGAEGIDGAHVHLVGNPLIDTLVRFRSHFEPERVVARLGLPSRYGVVTLHRPGIVDGPERLGAVVEALRKASDQVPLVFPVHPRGRERLRQAGLGDTEGIRMIDPLGYLDFMSLVSGAALVVTDSGGVQEETTVLRVPCLTLRPNTERPITVTHGTNRLVEPDDLVDAVRDAVATGNRSGPPPPLWDGQAGARIAAIVAAQLA